jgi:uncharacterized protein YbcV (DUF1398 family)
LCVPLSADRNNSNQASNLHFALFRNLLLTACCHCDILIGNDSLLAFEQGAEAMSKAVEVLRHAQERAMAGRPKIGGFPYLAEILRRAGVTRNVWLLPGCQSLYSTMYGTVATQGKSLIAGSAEVPLFNSEALIRALRSDQAGESTFQEFLDSTWKAGVVRYEVNLLLREVTYHGCNGEQYVESYPEANVD